MSKKKFIGKLLEFKYSDKKEVFKGIVLDYNNDWTFLLYNPVDYVADGFLILKNLQSLRFSKNTNDNMNEKILKIKIDSLGIPIDLPLLKIEDILKYISEKYGILEVQTDALSKSYLGKFKKLENNCIILKNLTPKAKWNGNTKLIENKIRIIKFDNDYINSIKLILKIKTNKFNF
ncbi:Hypothetical protein LBF_2189 [Leptospira biflexa serovar Patoc strain 'Patoc 1 (Ames)']|uniref:Uncharacterized protein n=1 Tax=Leptospira biflexa serovar Patoc (strain Patoc 1 / ATCC 23582 / Paris) TaxID=456481 RepID=B0STB1_LEPBP|nr:hypothetical protein [Leptospira biflexa]ABZ94686.1 Hypothetical protein LBF_2189 [Leptospira biflexa serovar Patoc strain 'Patoc 1 (Ames)']ABZ98351.1 Hypothetical protein LEPBI_I2255 [Leptospira biflexa serovar Patoc strain 'Patoc 1 (Paris)']